METKDRISSFDELFSHPQKIQIEGKTIELVDITPEHLKSDLPVIVAPGWGETLGVFKDSIQVLHNTGRRTISLNHPRRIKKNETSITLNAEGKRHPQSALQRALNILDVIDQKGLNKVDVISHSMGGQDVAIAASIVPEKFNSIVFVDPSGMIGHDTIPRLLGRFSKKMIHDSWLQFKEGVKYAAKNLPRAGAEVVSVSRSDVATMLKDLKKAGIKIGVIQGVNDPVFPIDRMQKIVSSELVDGFLSVTGGHDELHQKPHLYTKLAEEMLSSLEAK